MSMIPNEIQMNDVVESFSQSLTVIGDESCDESLTLIDDEDKDKDIDSLSQSLAAIRVKAHYRSRPRGRSMKKKGTAKKRVPARKSVSVKRTHIKEGKERARLSKAKKMDHESFKAIWEQMDSDKENFVPDQRSQERNELNAMLWNNFRNNVQHLPRKRNIKTRKEAKKEKAKQFQSRYIDALNNLDKPMPIEFM